MPTATPVRRPRTLRLLTSGILSVAVGSSALVAAPAHADTATTVTNSTFVEIPDHHIDRSADGSAIPAQGPAAVYPIATEIIASGRVTDVNVTLDGLTHTFPDDLDVMLVAGNGQSVMLMSDVGGNADINSVSYVFDDDATASLSTEANGNGAYLPTDRDVSGAEDPFPAPAPNASTATTSLRGLEGQRASGMWSVFIVDDTGNDSGEIFDIRIELTTDAVTSPYPININVPSKGGLITDVDVVLHGLHHTYLSDLQLALRGPDGRSTLLMSDVGGSAGIAGDLVLDDEAGALVGDPAAGSVIRPSRGDGELEPFRAPAPDINTLSDTLSVFDGQQAEGTWSLFVLDDVAGDPGHIAGGWSLRITTTDDPVIAVTSPPTTPAVISPSDKTALRVTSVTPHHRGDVRSPIAVRFSESVRKASVTKGGVTVRDAKSERRIKVTARWKSAGTQLVLVPVEPLRHGRTYVITASTQVRDASGNRLDQSPRPGRQRFVASFTTR